MCLTNQKPKDSPNNITFQCTCEMMKDGSQTFLAWCHFLVVFNQKSQEHLDATHFLHQQFPTKRTASFLLVEFSCS